MVGFMGSLELTLGECHFHCRIVWRTGSEWYNWIMMATNNLNIKKCTKEQLAQALADVLDGNSSQNQIWYITGLPKERCKEISELYASLLKS